MPDFATNGQFDDKNTEKSLKNEDFRNEKKNRSFKKHRNKLKAKGQITGLKEQFEEKDVKEHITDLKKEIKEKDRRAEEKEHDKEAKESEKSPPSWENAKPINPFELPDLPEKNEEFRYKENDKKFAAHKKHEKEDANLDARENEDKDSFNPFSWTPPSDETPLENKPLEEKPLDKLAEDKVKDEDAKISEDPAYSNELQNEDSEKEKEGSHDGDKITEEEFVPPSVGVLEGEVVQSESVKEKIGESSLLVAATEGKDEKINEIEDFKEGLWEVLEQAGITKGKIAVFLIVLIFAVTGFIGFLNGWHKTIFSWLSGSQVVEVATKSEVAVSVPPVSEKKVVPPAKNVPENELSAIDSVSNSRFLGIFYGILPGDIVADDSVTSALALGTGFSSDKNRLIYYQQLISQIDNIYNVDVYALVDKSFNRDKTLNDFLNQMKDLIDKSEQSVNEINSVIVNLNSAYESDVAQRDSFQSQFFTNAQILNGQMSYGNLEQFIAYSQSAVRLKAYLNAYKFVGDMLSKDLLALKPRYQDITLNFDAIVKGVRVFQIPGSDIKAIEKK
ncbi:hypothetical protein HZC20_03645 [Candidatus Peregrinibacteria bacterium]|nr:hypothetical protein [Candidatus Peregrinibacteria bacterium]